MRPDWMITVIGITFYGLIGAVHPAIGTIMATINAVSTMECYYYFVFYYNADF